MEAEQAQALAELIDEIVWRFGGHGLDGRCCEDISYVEYRALRALAQASACNMQDLARQLGFTKSGTTRVVDRLERKAYVRRERTAKDRRVCCVTLTAAGRALVERVSRERATRTQAAGARLGEHMQAVLVVSLKAFLGALNEGRPLDVVDIGNS